ncbi:MAG TPA: PspC domain-containing protein [Thermoleophilaceae bacterium]|jgi:phage shock protein PspC (stress-responsive transcriptional regulator)|nr:PspC domain-containing protein [Thermoleophilaceae bacterium]
MADQLSVRQRMGRRGLARPRSGRVVGGVCAGLARRFGMRAGLVRLLFVLSVILPGPQVLVYIALWIVMPSE